MNVGQQLSHYMLEEVIGTGGFGDVFRARDLQSGLEVAVKRSHVIAADKRQETEQRFLREISCTKKLNHPRIVQLYDYGTLPDGTLYLVMEYVRGITLEKKIKQEGKIPYLVASDIVLQTLGALSEAHNQGIVHRDLKPSNIMLAKQSNNNLLVKLLDFGIAKAFDGTEPDLTQEQFENGAGFGTPQYMPPEQFFGKQLGPHSDLYALGLVFYEMLTGKQAITGKTLPEVIQKQIREFPVIPEPFNQGPLYNIFQRSLAKSISARYESAYEMYSDLDGIVRHHSPFLEIYCQNKPQPKKPRNDYNQTLPLQQPFQTPECSPENSSKSQIKPAVSGNPMSGFSTIVYEKSALNAMANESPSLNLEAIKTEENSCVRPPAPLPLKPSVKPPFSLSQPSSSKSQHLVQMSFSPTEVTPNPVSPVAPKPISATKKPLPLPARPLSIHRPSTSSSQFLTKISVPATDASLQATALLEAPSVVPPPGRNLIIPIPSTRKSQVLTQISDPPTEVSPSTLPIPPQQPLSAASQPLPAAPQHLSATSQPLSAASQHLPAASQHLSAVPQPLSAASQRLSAASQHLPAAPQHLSATSQPLSAAPQPLSVPFTSPQEFNNSPFDEEEIEESSTILQPIPEPDPIVSLSQDNQTQSCELDISTRSMSPPQQMPEYLKENQEPEKHTGSFYQRATQYNINTDYHRLQYRQKQETGLISKLEQSQAGKSFLSTSVGKSLAEIRENFVAFIDTLYEFHFTTLVVAVCLAIGIISLIIILLLM